ncbi:MAG: hypothetical protein IJ685_01560 [Selenomonadaceae bacterium]|nr:hypothetical protein [Selenomonadaceae bacterium]
MKKFFVGVVLSVLLAAQSAFAMTFQQPVKLGRIGFPVQAPFHGYIIEGATQNDGKAYQENYKRRNGEYLTTYTQGIARFADLYCKYEFGKKIFSMDFGGKNNFILTQDGSDKEIFSIGNDAGIKLYVIYHTYCVTDLKILGTRKDDKWVVYIDSKKISDKYFGGKDAYKLAGGVLYEVPTCAGDTLIVQYRRWHWSTNGGISEPEGEFRFKWDDNAQWFGVEQVVY